MLSSIFLIVAIVSVDAQTVSFNSTNCTYPTPNDEFAASYYSSLITHVNPHVLKSLKMSGVNLSLEDFKVNIQLYGPGGLNLCNAGSIAYTCSRSFALAKEKTLKRYIKEVAFAMAQFLTKKNLLRCDNAVTLALRYYQDTENSLRKLDQNQFQSYLQAVNQGLIDFIKGLGYKVSAVIQQLADVYDEAYQYGLVGKCPSTKS